MRVSVIILLAMTMCDAQFGRNPMMEAIQSHRIIDQNAWRVAQPPEPKGPPPGPNVVSQFLIDVAVFTARGHRSNK